MNRTTNCIASRVPRVQLELFRPKDDGITDEGGCSRGVLSEGSVVSGSSGKKSVKFRAHSSNNSPRETDEPRDSLLGPLALDENGAGNVGLLLGGSKNGGRRYSVDDCGVNIVHRVELNTTQVTLVYAR